MVSCACLAVLEQNRAARASSGDRSMKLMGLAAQRARRCSRAAARSTGLENRRSPSASVWSAPSTDPAGQLGGNGAAPFRAPAAQPPAPASSHSTARCSIARSSTSAGTISTGRPAVSQDRASNRALWTPARAVVRRARAASLTAMGWRRRSVEKAHHRCRRFLDRTSRHVDARPIVPGAQLARERDLFGHCLPVDILIVVMMRLAAPAGDSGGSARSARGWRRARPPAAASSASTWRGTSHPGHDRHVAGLYAAVRKIDRGRRLRRCATRRPGRHRPPRDLRDAGRRRATSCS